MSGVKDVKHINYGERNKIEALLSAGFSVKQIAAQLSRHRSTIYKEIRRGRYMRTTTQLTQVEAYSSDIAQQDYNYCATAKGPSLKIGKDFAFAQYVEEMIVDHHYSPCAVLMKIAADGLSFATSVCFKTLYNYIDSHLFGRLERQHLPQRGQRKRKKEREVPARIKRPLCTSIEERPKEINSRCSFGHWEMDTVIGKAKGGGSVLLVLTERLTRYEIIFKMRQKTMVEVVRCLNRLERKFGSKFRRIFKTITVDNGSEFMNTEDMEKSCRTKGKRLQVFYCHPYSSWERGSNENINGLIRRFIPKGTPIDNYTDAQIAKIEQWVNNYPRRILSGKSSDALFQEHINSA